MDLTNKEKIEHIDALIERAGQCSSTINFFLCDYFVELEDAGECTYEEAIEGRDEILIKPTSEFLPDIFNHKLFTNEGAWWGWDYSEEIVEEKILYLELLKEYYED